MQGFFAAACFLGFSFFWFCSPDSGHFGFFIKYFVLALLAKRADGA